MASSCRPQATGFKLQALSIINLSRNLLEKWILPYYLIELQLTNEIISLPTGRVKKIVPK